jgi:hypothetical protein
MDSLKQATVYILGTLGILLAIALMHLAQIRMRGDGDTVEIASKKYVKKVEYMGNSVYETKYFPIDSLNQTSKEEVK